MHPTGVQLGFQIAPVGNGLDRSADVPLDLLHYAVPPSSLMLCVAANRALRREYEWLRRVSLLPPKEKPERCRCSAGSGPPRPAGRNHGGS
ncbi:MAG: hypothetical protein RR415_01865, partial [Ruthenibacterium sp.]